jgi:hypothetical protein
MRCLFLLFFFPLSGHSQFLSDSIPVNENGIVTYETVVEQPGSKDQLYTKAKLWIADNFKSANNVIQADDKKEGFIVVKAFFPYTYEHFFSTKDKKKTEVSSYPLKRDAYFTIKFFLKDNKYKVIITDIELEHTIDVIVISKYTWSIAHLLAMKNANLNEEESRVWQLDQLSEKRLLNLNFLNTIASIKSYMAKKAESDF